MIKETNGGVNDVQNSPVTANKTGTYIGIGVGVGGGLLIILIIVLIIFIFGFKRRNKYVKYYIS